MPKTKTAILLIIALFALTACTSKSPADTATGTEDPAVESTAEAVDSAAPASDECLNCHTDKQRLIDTAAPEPPAETESKGVG